MLAAFQICSSACSSEYCTKGCLLLWSFKNVLGLVLKICRALYTHSVHSFRFQMSNDFMDFNIFFKVKMLRHLSWYCTNVMSSLPMSLTMCSTGMTLDFCGLSKVFQKSRYWSDTFLWTVENAIYASVLPWMATLTYSICHAFKEYDQNL